MATKLLILVTEDWYFVSHRLSLAISAQKQGYDVVVAAREGMMAEIIRNNGIRFIPFSMSRRAGSPLTEIIKLCILYLRERPDIVHHVALKPVMLGSIARWLVRIPAQVNAIAGLGWLFTSSYGIVRFARPLIRRVLGILLDRPNSLTIVQNPDDFAVLNCSGIHTSRLRLISGAGVDTTVFTPTPAPDGPVTVMLVSRMLWDKGVAEFVEAAKILVESGSYARFILVGDPDPSNPASIPETMLQEWEVTHGVEWWGRREDMVNVWQFAHIACLPSYREGMPKSLLEASACGLPIVTTDVPGCRDVVEHNVQGLLVPAHDVSALAAAIALLIEQPYERSRMGENSRARAVEEFSQEIIVAQTMSVYEEVVIR